MFLERLKDKVVVWGIDLGIFPPEQFNIFLALTLLVYPLIFTGVGLAFGRKYFVSSPDQTKYPNQWQFEMQEYDRQQNVSLTLAGFAFTALTFIIALRVNELVRIEHLIGYFSLAFFLEMFSAFLTGYRMIRFYKYLSFVLQYTGLLAIFNGFFAFLMGELPNSFTLEYIYFAGLALFYAITLPELILYRRYWKSI